ncbi:hypothetical protein [sulfur-oxidizing endosymbiont of Gigantopelta aegis]|uniref:hypothetical protein n=1 Tax=sulfur-oxidizing endosymbiont of Gigantopelta aegis TaxID=2794934 RepID=UPI0018DDADC1|nr:hypothetical protein [sulfur-oxidizing endosymbiont of Gigantopelta aegis]
MATSITFHSEQAIIYFSEQEQYFVLQLFFYDVSRQAMMDNQNKINLSFDQCEQNGAVLKDGISFEMELNIESWEDISEQEAVYPELGNDFICGLSKQDKQWFSERYQQACERLI